MIFFQSFLDLARLVGVLLILIGTGFSNSFVSIGLGIYAGALFLEVILQRKLPSISLPHKTLFFIFFIFLFISFGFHHEYPATSIKGIFKYLTNIIAFVAILDVTKNKNRFDFLTYSLIAALSVSAFAGLWQYWFGYDFIHFRSGYTDEGQTRLIGPLKHYNDYGSTLIVGVFLSLASFKVFITKKKFFLIMVSIFLSVTSIFVLTQTFSRSACIAFAASLILGVLFFKSRKYILPGFLIGIVFLVFFSGSFGTRFQQIFNMEYGSTTERLALVKTSMGMIQKSPLLGLGINTYSIYFPDFRPPDYLGIKYAHNSYLQIAAEIGLLGLLLFLLPILKSLMHIRSRLARIKGFPEYKIWAFGFFASANALLINALFESLLQATRLRILFWVVLGFSLAAFRFVEKDKCSLPNVEIDKS